MKKIDVKRLVVSALLASFVCVATMIIQIPNGIGGYFNLGDSVVLLCGWLLGPVYGALAAGIGSALADVFSPYAIYAPATFVIKLAMAVVAFYVVKALAAKRRLAAIVSGIAAEFVMICGYCLFEGAVLYNFASAFAAIPSNLLQGAAGIACAFLLKEFVDRKRLWKY